MPIIESDSGEDLYLTEVDMNVLATCELDVFIALRSTVNMAVTATCDLSVFFDGETEADMAVMASATLKLAGEPDTFGETEADLAVTATCELSQIQIGNTQVDMAVTATCELYVTEAEQFSIAFIADLGRPDTSTRSERRAILTVDGEEIPIKEADWIEDEGSTDYRLAVVLAELSDGDLITKDSSIGFFLQRKISNVWTTTTVLLEDGQVDEAMLELGRKDGANADTFSFTGQTPLQKRFNVTPLTDLIMFDPQKLTLESEDFDLIFDTNGQEYEVELMDVHGLRMNDVFEEAFTRMGFTAWHSDVPDEFIELSRVDFKGGRSMIEEIRSLVGFYAADFQLIGDTVWIKDGTVEHPSSLPVRQVTIRGGKLKALNQTEKFERYDGVDLTYDERGLEYDFTTTRVDTPPARTVTVGGITTSTQNVTTVIELRRNSQPDRIIDEKVSRIAQTVTQNSITIRESLDRRSYDLYGNLIRQQVEVDARIPSLSLPGTFIMDRVQDFIKEDGYKGHPFELDKIYRYRSTAMKTGLILVDSQNPMLGETAKQDISTAYQSLNLAEGQTTEFGPIEHEDEWVFPLRDKRVQIQRQRVNYINPAVEADPEVINAGDVGISTLINIEKRLWVFPRGVFNRSPDKLLDLDAGPIPLRFAQPAARRHLSMLQNLPGRVSATAIDFDESIIKGTTVNFRGREGVDLGICRITGRRLSIRPRAWTASYTARQVGVSNEYILVDNEDPYTPAEIAMDSNEQHTITVRFECFAGYSIRCTSVADLTVEMRAVGDVSWINIETTPIDMTPYALTIQEFEVRLTTGTIAAPVRVQFNIYASPS